MWSPDTSLLATARAYGLVPLWEVQNGQELVTIQGHNAGVLQGAGRLRVPLLLLAAMMQRFASGELRGKALHLFQTHFINPDGLTYYNDNGNPLPGHYSSARDLARLTTYALSNPLFAKIVGTRQYDLAWSPKHGAYHWSNTNGLFNLYPATTGVKTGFTNEAGCCLVFSATRDRHHLIGTVLFSSNTDINQRFRDAKTLLEWGIGLPMLPAY